MTNLRGVRLAAAYLTACLLAGGMMIRVTPAQALRLPVPDVPAPDTTSWREVLLAVADVGGTCAPDSIFGRAYDSRHYLPTRITWGTLPPGFPPCPGDTISSTYAQTTFEYPAWDNLLGTLSVQRVNAGDSLADLVFAVWGRTTGSSPHDTLRRVCIFGRRSLATLATVNLATLPTTQITPFAALDLVVGGHLVEPEGRDMTGRTSYVLVPPEAPGPPPPRTELASVGLNVNVSPNPTHGPARIEGHPIPAGEYRVEVIAADGATALRRLVTVGADGGLFDRLDLGELPTGFYMIRVFAVDGGNGAVGADGGAPSSGRLVGDYPIIKQR